VQRNLVQARRSGQVGDRHTDETGELEVVTRPVFFRGGFRQDSGWVLLGVYRCAAAVKVCRALG